jgi:putative YhbY family RNA-binding protein
MKTLDSALRRTLRARAHSLRPVAAVSHNGLTAALVAEIERCLTAHELIKVRVFGEDRTARDELLTAICAATNAAPVQHIGNILVLFREAPPDAPGDARPAGTSGKAAVSRPRPRPQSRTAAMSSPAPRRRQVGANRGA